MWFADSEIMKNRDLMDTKRPQLLRGQAPLWLMTAASVLIHALVLGLLLTTVVNPFAWESERQDPTIIKVTLASLIANNVSRPNPISLPPTKRENVNADSNKKPSDVVIGKKQARQPNPEENNQKSLFPPKTAPMDPTPLNVSNIQQTPLSDKVMGELDPAAGGPSSANFSGPNRVPATGEDLSVVKPRYALTPSPTYPTAARTRGQEGLVILAVEVLASGRTGQVLVKKSSGYALLDQSAQNTIRSWRFEPARRQQTPQAMIVDIPIRFSLKNDR
jgi:periplasmic protein TonB